MSGGSYDYAFQKIDDVKGFAATLDDMADRCRKWAAETETKWEGGKDVPITLEERARIMVAALRLEHVAKQVRTAHAALETVSDLMRDVEWIASGDYGVDTLFKSKESK